MWRVCLRVCWRNCYHQGGIGNICLYFHRTWKHSSSDIEEFCVMFLSKTYISVEVDTDFWCFRCGLVMTYCVAQCNHRTWMISIVHELWMGLSDTTVKDYTKTLLARHFYSGHFQNAIEYCMRCNMRSMDTSVPFHWVSLLHSTICVGYWTSQRGILLN